LPGVLKWGDAVSHVAPAPQFPLPPVVRLTNVEPGDSAVGEAGPILRVVGTATAGLTGDDAGFFRIDGVETLQLVKDPDAPARAWETVSDFFFWGGSGDARGFELGVVVVPSGAGPGGVVAIVTRRGRGRGRG
jgi:hypothetical protein